MPGEPSLSGSHAHPDSGKLAELRACLAHVPWTQAMNGTDPHDEATARPADLDSTAERLAGMASSASPRAAVAAGGTGAEDDGAAVRTPRQEGFPGSAPRLPDPNSYSDLAGGCWEAGNGGPAAATPAPPLRAGSTSPPPSSRSSSGSASGSMADEVYVARMVAEICSRCATRADLESDWRGRVGLLERQLGLARAMTRAALRQHRAALEAVEPWAQSVGQGMLIVGATLAGGAAALLALRFLSSRAGATAATH